MKEMLFWTAQIRTENLWLWMQCTTRWFKTAATKNADDPMQVVWKQKGLYNGRGDHDIGIGYIDSAETYVKQALKKPRAGWRSNQNATRELKIRQKAQKKKKELVQRNPKREMTTKQDQDPTEVVQGSWKTTKEKRKKKTLPEGAKVEKNSKKPQLHIQKEKSGKTRDPRKQNSMGTHKSKNL
jgi:hypothetical protein